MNNNFIDTMKKYTDEEYFKLLCRAEYESEIDGVKMPAFPDREIQVNTVGHYGEQTLKEGFTFYKHVKQEVANLHIPINENTTLLDFGLGWGRLIRFYFKDIKSENIYGIDVAPEMIQICKETLPCGDYSVTTPLPPTKFADNTFDIIFAYSVFTHLREDAALKWIEEFSRILKPNGVLVATVRGLAFLEDCEYYRRNPKKTARQYHDQMTDMFSPIDKYRTKYSNGEFLYYPTGGGSVLDKSFYGEAVIPMSYIFKNWTPHLSFKSFREDILPQSTITMQKRAYSLKNITDVLAKIDALEMENRDLQNQAIALHTKNETQYLTFINSASWRITKPLRWIKGLFNK